MPDPSSATSPAREGIGGVGALAGAACLWGASGALISRFHSNGVAVAAIMSLAAGIALLGLGRVTGESVREAIRTLRWWILLLALLEGVNATTYYTALRLAPLGTVIALHLCSPVLMLLVDMARRRRRVDLRGAVSLVSLAAALVVTWRVQPASGGYPHPLLGAVLSLTGAAALAVFIVVVGRFSAGVPRLSSAGAQMCCTGVLLLPLTAALPPVASEVPWLLAVGVLVFAPAVFLYWQGLRSVGPIVGATIQFLEPVSATIVGIFLFSVVPTVLQLAVVALTIWSAWLVATRRRAPN